MSRVIAIDALPKAGTRQYRLEFLLRFVVFRYIDRSPPITDMSSLNDPLYTID